jgi:hypothetical protein
MQHHEPKRLIAIGCRGERAIGDIIVAVACDCDSFLFLFLFQFLERRGFLIGLERGQCLLCGAQWQRCQ